MHVTPLPPNNPWIVQLRHGFAIMLAVVLAAALAAYAATPPSDGGTGATMKPPFSSVSGGFVALSVPDLEKSANWYVEKLGLKVVKHAVAADGKSAVTILQGNGLSVELIWLAAAVPLAQIAPKLQGAHQVHGIFKAGIFVDDLDTTLRELKARNVTMAFEPFYDASMQCRMFAIRDHDGNILQFFGK